MIALGNTNIGESKEIIRRRKVTIINEQTMEIETFN